MQKFKKVERLRSKKQIDSVFSDGKLFYVSFYKVFWKEKERDVAKNCNVQVLITVPKQHFKKAVLRNMIKRRIREAYRLNKHILYKELSKQQKKLDIIVIYTAKKVSDFKEIQEGIIEVFKTLLHNTIMVKV